MNRIVCCFLAVFLGLSMAGFQSSAHAQYGQDGIYISEFFDDILRVNVGSTQDLVDIDESDNISSMAIASSNTAYVVNFSEIWRVTGSGSVTTLADLSGTVSSEIVMDLDGNLLAVNSSDGIRRINVNNGNVSTVYNDSLWSADDIVVSAEGTIYATEFFDGLGRVNTDGSWTKLGDWDANFFSHIDMGPDGYLYLATTFEDGDIYRVNPWNGHGHKIADNVFTFIDDLDVAPDGTIYLAGAANSDADATVEDLVMAIDPNTGNWTVVVDENQTGSPSPPFFNPRDIVWYNANSSNFYFSAVP